MVTFHFVHPTLVRCMVAGSLALALTATGIAAAQPPYDGIVVFGTSLSDSGNAFALRERCTSSRWAATTCGMPWRRTRPVVTWA
jgi:phospholipase/lecithinase/hemolysin